jgi:hypothetical protein
MQMRSVTQSDKPTSRSSVNISCVSCHSATRLPKYVCARLACVCVVVVGGDDAKEQYKSKKLAPHSHVTPVWHKRQLCHTYGTGVVPGHSTAHAGIDADADTDILILTYACNVSNPRLK